MHQLPAVTAPRRGVERGLRQGRAHRGRRPHARVRLRARASSNVTRAAAQLGVHYPIAIDNDYATWDNYQNEYWPAEYLIDATGTVRHVDFGEGQYGQTETFIRQLLEAADPPWCCRPAPTCPTGPPQEPDDARELPRLPLRRAQPAGERGRPDAMTAYRRPGSLPQDAFAFGGHVGPSVPRPRWPARRRPALHFQAQDVYLVLGGTGTIDGLGRRGARPARWPCRGEPRLYQLVGPGAYRTGPSPCRSRGVEAYDFTFG